MSNNIFDWKEQAKNLKGVATKGAYSPDTRFWKLQRDKETGTGVAIVRFLPFVAVSDNSINMYVGYKALSAQRVVNGKTRYLIGKSPASINLPCPIGEFRNSIINNTDPLSEEIKKSLGYKNRFIANVMIVKDPLKPENNGKIFMFEFGANVAQKLQEWGNPSEVDLATGAVAKNAFDPLKGFEVKLKIARQGGNGAFSYGTSEIGAEPKQAIEGIDTPEKYIEWAKANLFDLDKLYRQSADEYDTYEELKDKLNFVFPEAVQTQSQQQPVTQTTPKPDFSEPEVKVVEATNPSSSDDDDWL